ncbi:hypothetical protein FRX31_006512 [Thalictrum thalictroides]|uniref:Reverse transcriptase zinc-binding domain-containing protein n=1 Tax=Thalictrum thalictroides TaxID=46969 RepID=A0A7J6X2F6_THATH|nr:hypothetical protein FRX31_006512 [Thalictrum thalictroides]
MWTLNWNRILTVDQLQRRGLVIPNRCCMCNSANETIDHLFLQCNFARFIWGELTTIHSGVRYDLQNWITLNDLLLNWPSFNSKDIAAEIWGRLPYAVIWCIWRSRNRVTTEKDKVLQAVKATSWAWLNMSKSAMEL